MRLEGRQFVLVPVPPDFVVDVYRLIVEKTRVPVAQALSQTRSPTVGLPDDWSAAEIKRMYAESGKNMRAILSALSERAGEKVPSNDLIEVLAQSRGTAVGSSILGGTLGAFGRRLKNRYRKNSWPFEAHWIPETNQNYYVMSPGVAALIKGE